VSAVVLTEPRVDFDQDVEARRRDADEDYDGWYCVATSPFPCPAAGCGFVARHMTAAHLVVVWPRIDDPALLGQARGAREVGRNPRVVAYEPGFGPCISWDEWQRIGRPIHGRIARPDGWEDEPWRL
jgi:hypothetical protein